MPDNVLPKKDPEMEARAEVQKQMGGTQPMLQVASMMGAGLLASVPNIPDGLRAPLEQLKDIDKVLNPDMGERMSAARAVVEGTKREIQEVVAPQEPVQEAQAQETPETVQLDAMALMQIELLATKQKLNKAYQQNLELSMLDLKREEKVLRAQEVQLIQEVSNKLKLGPGKSLRLVDRTKGICKVE